jgi:phage terminase large subunit
MADQNAESIKSLENYNVAWVEEAQTLSNRSFALLRPTIRASLSTNDEMVGESIVSPTY